MADAKHTPGPWRADCDYGGVWGVRPAHPARGFSGGYVPLAALRIDARLSTHRSAECQAANAALIAAAPELLDGLLKAICALAGGLWDYGPGQDEHDKCEEVLSDLRAIVAKATGSAS